ncbi:peptidoglycan DD-metalloendopeptidase family protein [Salinisphaera sp. T31B1]|uniref:murein hydrolase activator EnvC family protein n=1 Tax=Salinisphaera sp. T31B1 TaxID=727963 RepID=UPI00333FB4F0
MTLSRLSGRRSMGRRLLRLCLCLVVLGPVAGTANADDDSRSARAQAELDALRDRIDTVRGQIAADQSQRSDLADRLSAAETEIHTASKHLRELDGDIKRAQARVDDLAGRRNAEREDLADQLAALRAQVRAAYSSGRMDKMRLLLSGQSPEKLGRMLVYYEYFARAQTRQVATLREALADLIVRQKALETQQKALSDQRSARAATLSRLESNQRQRRQTIDALDKRLSSRTASLKELRADAARLEKLMGTLSEELADLPSPASGDIAFSRLKGRMAPPVRGKMLARFGSRKAGGPLRWQGIWLAAPEGTPVKSVASGRVVYVGYMHRYGLIVIIDHGHNYYTLYGHAESTYVEVGDAVTRNQTIARAGRTGGHRRSGTYFEIRRGQTPINPADWLSG